jgi:endonuclease G, mitochondrial
MLQLNNEDRKQLREAILSAYPSPSSLEIFVSEELDHNLAAIASSNNLAQTAFDLIKWAIARGYLDNLVLALSKDGHNPRIQRFCSRVLPQYLQLNDQGTAASLALSAVPENCAENWPADWGIEVSSEEFQAFLPKQYSFEADVGELQRGLALADSVCKITFLERPDACGTGVLIASDLVLTNYHVLSLEAGADLSAIAPSIRFQFGEVSKLGQSKPQPPIAAVKDNGIVCASPIHELDYVLLRIEPNPSAPMRPVPFDATSTLMPHSSVHILQHPEGEQMKVSLSHNGIVKTQDSRGLVLYVNRTMGGSSGSPCFNQQWKLVALHHKELATSFGSVREGILFSAIYPQIASFL